MQPDTTIRRPAGRPRRDAVPLVDRMAAALVVYHLDLGNRAAIYRALWAAGFPYSEAIPHVGEAIAVAQACTGRR